MKQNIFNKITGFAAIWLAVVAAGCANVDNSRPGGERIALQSVSAQLGNPSQQTVTRVVSDDPTLTSVEERYAEGHVMKVTVAGITEIYEYDNGRFVPAGDPVYFPNSGAETVEFRFGAEVGGIMDQNGTAEELLAADRLTATRSIAPASTLESIILTHANSLIELVFDAAIDVDRIEDVGIGGVAACKIPNTGRYLAIIQPGIDSFKITLTYKGHAGYGVTVGKDAVTGSVREFEPNCRYSLVLGIDETDLSLRLQAMSIAAWVDGEEIEATVL